MTFFRTFRWNFYCWFATGFARPHYTLFNFFDSASGSDYQRRHLFGFFFSSSHMRLSRYLGYLHLYFTSAPNSPLSSFTTTEMTSLRSIKSAFSLFFVLFSFVLLLSCGYLICFSRFFPRRYGIDGTEFTAWDAWTDTRRLRPSDLTVAIARLLPRKYLLSYSYSFSYILVYCILG